MAIQPATKLRTSYKNTSRWDALHSGGQASLAAEGKLLCTTLDSLVAVTLVESGERVASLAGDMSPVTCLASTTSDQHSALLTGHQSLSLRLYLLSTTAVQLLKVVAHAHDAPIVIAAADSTSSLFATGDVAGVVKLWDAHQGHCTHVFKGHGGAISALTFDVDQAADSGRGRARLIVGGSDGKVRAWDLMDRRLVALLDGHTSAVRGVAVTQDGSKVVTGGRDKLLNIWELGTSTSARLILTVPVYETLEAVSLAADEPAARSLSHGGSRSSNGKERASASVGQVIVTAGDLGLVRVWDIATGRLIRSTVRQPGDGGFVDARMCGFKILVLGVDHVLAILVVPSLEVDRHIVGFNDEIVDLCLLSRHDEGQISDQRRDLAVATNSPAVRLYGFATNDVTFLRGHTDVVLSLACSDDRSILATGSKDRTARIWQRSNVGRRDSFSCIGTCEGHVGSVGAIALTHGSLTLLATASQDRTVKIWDLAADLLAAASQGDPAPAVRSLLTLKIHDKDINALDISPNDRLLASGSQDRLAKIFELRATQPSTNRPAAVALRHIGTLKGHTRGIWTVRFSEHDRCVATGSGDRTIKLWSLSDFTCLKTFEGHTNSVLRVAFMTASTQLVSTASDGLIKAWNLKDEHCNLTLDAHEEKVWALAVDADGRRLVTGGGDSRINVWEDVTEAEEEEQVQATQRRALRLQDYDNFVSLGDFRNGIILALTMENSARLLSLFRRIADARPTSLGQSADADSITGLVAVDEVIRDLRHNEVVMLLRYVREWNALARTADIAQSVLHAIFRYHNCEDLLTEVDHAALGGVPDRTQQGGATARDDIASLLEALVPFTERHLLRVQKTAQEASMVRYLLAHMADSS